MTCARDTEVARLFDGDLPDDQTRPLEQHIAGCDTCAETLRLLEQTQRLLSSLPPIPAPPQLAAVVGQRLDALVAPALARAGAHGGRPAGGRSLAAAALLAGLLCGGSLLMLGDLGPARDPHPGDLAKQLEPERSQTELARRVQRRPSRREELHKLALREASPSGTKATREALLDKRAKGLNEKDGAGPVSDPDAPLTAAAERHAENKKRTRGKKDEQARHGRAEPAPPGPDAAGVGPEPAPKKKDRGVVRKEQPRDALKGVPESTGRAGFWAFRSTTRGDRAVPDVTSPPRSPAPTPRPTPGASTRALGAQRPRPAGDAGHRDPRRTSRPGQGSGGGGARADQNERGGRTAKGTESYRQLESEDGAKGDRAFARNPEAGRAPTDRQLAVKTARDPELAAAALVRELARLGLGHRFDYMALDARRDAVLLFYRSLNTAQLSQIQRGLAALATRSRRPGAPSGGIEATSATAATSGPVARLRIVIERPGASPGGDR